MRFLKNLIGTLFLICTISWFIMAFVLDLPQLFGSAVLGGVVSFLLLRKTKKDKERARKRKKLNNARVLVLENRNDYSADIDKDKVEKQYPETHTTTAEGEFVTVQTEHASSNVPDDVAMEMRKYYTLMQAQRDAEIMTESYRLACITRNLETFCSRYDLAMRKAHTLLQAEQVGVRDIQRLNCHNACIAVINTAGALKVRVLHDFAENEMSQANALKTNKGKQNRYIKMLATLEQAKPTFMFMDEYNTLIERVKKGIADFGGAI